MMILPDYSARSFALLHKKSQMVIVTPELLKGTHLNYLMINDRFDKLLDMGSDSEIWLNEEECVHENAYRYSYISARLVKNPEVATAGVLIYGNNDMDRLIEFFARTFYEIDFNEVTQDEK